MMIRLRYRTAVAVAASMLASLFFGEAVAQRSDIPVLVAGEDEDPNSVRRNHDIFKRVIAELKDVMVETGFRVVDEESVGVDLEWKVTERRPKTELLQVARQATDSRRANMQVRALVLFRVHATKLDMGWRTELETRMAAEIYDIRSNSPLVIHQMPNKTYYAPPECYDDALCISEVVGEEARSIATELGSVIAKELAHLQDTLRAESGPGEPANSDFGLQTPYTVTLKQFETRDALAIKGFVEEEFEGTKSVSLITRRPAVRRYEVVSTARPHKLDEMLTELLIGLGYDVDRSLAFTIEGTDITITNFETPDASAGNSQ